MDKLTQEMIDETLRAFNFGKVHLAMVALKWGWEKDGGTPSVAELQKKARELLVHVRERWLEEIKDDEPGEKEMHVFFASEGGFYAEAGHGVFRLQFVIAEQEMEWDEIDSERPVIN